MIFYVKSTDDRLHKISAVLFINEQKYDRPGQCEAVFNALYG